MKASLLDFVKSQNSLVTLHLYDAGLSPSETTELLSSLCQSSSVASLEDLNINGSADFDSDEACEYLAQLIDTALALKKLNIDGQDFDRYVKLNIDYAVVADPADDKIDHKQGSIRVIRK